MKKINYPHNEDFKSNYYELLKNDFNEEKINEILKKIESSWNFEKLLTANFIELLEISNIEDFEKKVIDELNSIFFDKKKDRIIYHYEVKQPKISKFIMDNDIDMKTCHYCNIDFINTIEEQLKFSSLNQFYLEAPYEVLMLIPGIKKNEAEEIINKRVYNKKIDWLKERFPKFYRWSFNKINSKTTSSIDKLDLKNITIKKNHFTLDHILPKNKFPFLSLSLFNLVPSCYSCNSKFKNQREFTINKELEKISPTSDKFELNELIKFKMRFDICDNKFEEKIKKIKEIKDVIIEIENKDNLYTVDEFIEIFKLRPRYEFHKEISFKMIKKRKIYSDSQIKEIAQLLKRDEQSIKEDLFGKECFESNNEPFEKYKQDIAKQLGIIK
ncbi:HNH endonuclease [Flavobacterium filum]|mgnify:CR=1 FL=1|uniref:HNH endonuclease n=1 Tax=Flavobacterium filum TaxID=370974 RepID=UPI0023F26A33|nr:HNH endonuclease [Flavobacterium filum]